MNGILELIKSMKWFLIASGIIIVIAISVVLFENNRTKPDAIDNKNVNSVPLKNDINASVTKYTFNLPQINVPDQLDVYKANLISTTDIKNIADKLNFKTESITEGKYSYTDNAGNSLLYYSIPNTLYINNTNSPLLKGFIPENTLTKLADIFNKNLSAYSILSNTTAPDGTKVVTFAVSIKSYKIITDYDQTGSLNVYINKDGSLSNLTWQYKEPISAGKYKAITLDYIKNNIGNISQGIYPDFLPSSSSNDENLPQVEDFTGQINITGVEIAYLWSLDKKDYIIPVYRLTGQFVSTSGKNTTGSVIIQAVEGSF